MRSEKNGVNTVVVLEAGIGALSLGFWQAGFQVTAAFEKNKKSIDIYKRNLNDEIYERDLSELSLQEVPKADVIAADLTGMPVFKAAASGYLRDNTKSMYLKKVYEILKINVPQIFCFVLPVSIYRTPVWTEFMKELSDLNYQFQWKEIGTRELTGLPVTEKRVYLIGSRQPGCALTFPAPLRVEDVLPIYKFADREKEEDWYDKFDREKIQETTSDDCFFCWRRDKYVEKPYVDWNLVKPALIRVNGEIHKLTHHEMAKLKGFPAEFKFELGNKAWLYRALAYAPNVLVVRRVAECLKDSQARTSLQNMQAPERKFEKLFEDYLRQQDGILKRGIDQDSDCGVDMIYSYGDVTYCFQVKYYPSEFGMERSLRRLCGFLSEYGNMERYSRILVTANIVRDDIKESCRDEFGVSVWDVKNLLWLFEEFTEIKNEFVALLNYSIESIRPEEPVPRIFHKKEEKPEHLSLKEKLRRIKLGKEQYQQYEELCVEILKYVMGDYLTLWNVQEKTDSGMYRFDLCCKIKNGVDEDFFNTVRQYFHTKYIVFEFKNYNDQITQKEIYTTEKYLYEKALRRVAVIISRKGASNSALAAARGSLRETGKLILCLSDDDLMDLIDIKDKNEQSTGSFLEAMLDDILIHLEK